MPFIWIPCEATQEKKEISSVFTTIGKIQAFTNAVNSEQGSTKTEIKAYREIPGTQQHH